MQHTWLAMSAVLLSLRMVNAQPLEYSLEAIDDQGNCIVEQLNIALGTSHTLIEGVGRATQLLSSRDGSLLFLQIRGALEVRALDSPTIPIRILDGVEWVHEVLDIPSVSRCYVSIGSDDAPSATILFDRQNWQPLDTIQEFWTFEHPILSQDGATIYRSKSDSSHIRFFAYNSINGQKGPDVLFLTPSGFASAPVLHDGREGKALLSYETPPGGFATQRYIVCDLDSSLEYPSFEVTFRSDGTLSAGAEYALIEAVDWDSTRIPLEYRPGEIRVVETRTGVPSDTHSFPPQGRVFVGSDVQPLAYYFIAKGQAAIPIPRPPPINVPTLRILTPALTLTRSGEFTLNITGSGFVNGSQVLWNGLDRPTIFRSSTELTAGITGRDVASPITAAVTVRNPDGSVSAPLSFSVVTTLPQPVRPILECVTRNPDRSYTAWFGYKNLNNAAVYLPVGQRNRFTPGPKDRGQPTVFLPGRKTKVFSVHSTGHDLDWTLNDRTSTASRDSERCR